LKQCLNSIRLTKTNYKIETIVADNGSTDGSLDMVRQDFPEVKIIANGANLDLGIQQASGKYILLLNSDTTVDEQTFDETIKYLDAHPEVGALGAKVLLPDGTLDKACRRRFPNPINSFLRLFGLKKFSDYNITGDVDQAAEVDAVMGAYMAVPRSVIEKIGLLDEQYFMYGEDLDWCWRIKHASYKIVYYPKSVITHYKYGSSKTIPFQVVRWAHEAMKIFYRKHYAPAHSWLFNQLVYLGIKLRMYLVLAVNLFRKKKSVH
jgi:GT2 family glycosyltransferase